jgi:DNA polymerase (family X)
MISNRELAALFGELADIMELAGENFFKIKAYRQAAGVIEKADDNIAELPSEKLLEMPGIGKAISEKIAEARTTGTFPTLEKWRATGFAEFLPITAKSPLLSVKTIRKLIKEFGFGSYNDLKNALADGKISESGKIDPKVIKVLEELDI